MSVSYTHLLIACFGCPKQEKWIYENIDKYDAKVTICAGATVDFLAGNVKRAPRWMSDHGLESVSYTHLASLHNSLSKYIAASASFFLSAYFPFKA